MTPSPALVDALDAALPQTQCRRCGHDGCRPYAQAIAEGEAINRCPPGEVATLVELAQLTGRPIIALDASRGTPGPLEVARIDEAACIGCTLCLQACPVDAIIGGARRMHGVLSALCSGCGLCVPPCPVDCILMVPAGRAWSPADRDAARTRHAAVHARRARTSAPAVADRTSETSTPLDARGREAALAAALQRARTRRAARSTA